MPCMVAAVNTYNTGRLLVLGNEPKGTAILQLFPNPVQDTVQLRAAGAASVSITDAAGRQLGVFPVGPEGVVSLATLAAGVYVLTAYDKRGNVLGTARVLKR